MPKYMVVKDADGNVVAHGAGYSLKEGESEAGEVEAKNVDAATKKARKQAAGEQDDADEGDEAEGSGDGEERQKGLLARTEPTEEEKERDNELARKAEEEKEEFTVMADGTTGEYYIEGDEASDPSMKKKAAAKKAPEPPEDAEVGKFRAKNAKEALAMAKGTHRNPAEGAQRGAQTP